MAGDIVVSAPAYNSLMASAYGMGSDFPWDTPIINYAGINAKIAEVKAGLATYLASLSTLLMSQTAVPLHMPPPGYHFGSMDPMGNHYMVKDGDNKNTPVVPPWYSMQIQDNVNAFNTSSADLSLGLLGLSLFPGAAPFAGFVGGMMTVLSWGAAHSEPAASPIFP